MALQLTGKIWPCKCNQEWLLSVLETPLVWITKMCYNLSFTCRCYLGNWILCSYDEELKTSIFPISARWLSIEILFVGLQILLSSCFAVALCRKKRHVDCSVIWKSGSLCCRDTLYACIKIVTFT